VKDLVDLFFVEAKTDSPNPDKEKASTEETESKPAENSAEEVPKTSLEVSEEQATTASETQEKKIEPAANQIQIQKSENNTVTEPEKKPVEEKKEKSEEAQKIETKTVEKPVEPIKTEDFKKIEEPKKTEEPTKIEEPKKTEEVKKIEEPLKIEESKKIEETVKIVESKKTEEPVKTPEVKKIEEPAKLEETKKIEEPVKIQEPVKTEEPKKPQEPVKIEETKKLEVPVKPVESEKSAPSENKVEAQVKIEEPAKKEESEKPEHMPITEEKTEEPMKGDNNSPPKVEEDEDVLQESPSSEKKSTGPRGQYVLLEKLMSFLAGPVPLNPILAGYFSKVFVALLEKRKSDLLDYIFHVNSHMNNILKHSYNKSISEILGKIVSNEDRFGGSGIVEEFSEEKHMIVEALVEKMGPKNSSEDITNNCYILCTLIDNKQQLSYFMGKPVLEKVFSYAASDNPMSLRAALTFLIIIYRLKSLPAPPAETPAFLGFVHEAEPQKTEEIPDFKDLLDLSISFADYAKKYLEEPNKNSNQDMQFGDSVIPFGLDRLKVIEWLQSLISLKDEAVCKKVTEIEFPKTLLGLMRKYDINSVLHYKVFKIFEDALTCGNEDYIDAFSIKCDLAEWIILFNKESNQGKYRSTGKSFNKAYTPFINKLASQLFSLTESNQKYKDYLNSKPAWKEFEAGDYKKRLEKETKTLGGEPDKPHSEDPIEEPELVLPNTRNQFTSHGENKEGEGKEPEIVEENNDENGKLNIEVEEENKEQVENEDEKNKNNYELLKKELNEKAEAESKLIFKIVSEDIVNPTADEEEKTKQDVFNENLNQVKKESPEKITVSIPAPQVIERPEVPIISTPVQVENPLVTQYASNNYWRSDEGLKIDDLEKDYC